jgi:hypothetical protein
MKGYGVVRYLPGSGAPEDDDCHFDGWYRSIDAAREVYHMWREAYPEWTVGLVGGVEIRFGGHEAVHNG